MRILSDLIRIHHEDYREDIPFWLAQTRDRDPLLELGCGHGRVYLPLMEAGHQVIGLDHEPHALRYLHSSLNRNQRGKSQIIMADLLQIPITAKFGAALIPCNTYSIFSTFERSQILQQVFGLLKTDGIFIASLPNPTLLELTMRDLEGAQDLEPDLENVISHPRTGFPVQVSSQLRVTPRGLCWDWLYEHLLPDGGIERFVHSTEHHLTSPAIYEHELFTAGFKSIQLLGDFDSNPYQQASSYLIIRAAK